MTVQLRYTIFINMTRIFLISLSHEDDELERYIKDISDDWAHYLPCTWFVHTSMTIQELTDGLVWRVRSHDPSQHLFVTEIVPSNYNGWLPQGAWLWLSKMKRKLEFSTLENPTLVDRYNYGEFDDCMSKINSVADIDTILQSYETTVSSFDLANVRSRMINDYINRIFKRTYNRL